MPLNAIRVVALLAIAFTSLRAAGDAAPNRPNLFSPPGAIRPLKIAIFDGPGSGESGIKNVSARARQLPQATVTALKPAEVGTRDLAEFDIIVFSGGSGRAQSKAIGEAGRRNVQEFVRRGGGYLGVCAGAYLACAGFDWSLGLLNAKTVSGKWKRGRAMVRIELTDEGRGIFGPVSETFTIRYANGPIIQPLGRAGLPPYETAAVFRSEVAENGSPQGVMVSSPAIVFGTFGQGRVLTLSPHSEDTPGLENVIPRALAWLAER